MACYARESVTASALLYLGAEMLRTGGVKGLKTGEVWGEREYDTTSTAWEGVFSAMTEKQVRAICKDIVTELSKP